MARYECDKVAGVIAFQPVRRPVYRRCALVLLSQGVQKPLLCLLLLCGPYAHRPGAEGERRAERAVEYLSRVDQHLLQLRSCRLTLKLRGTGSESQTPFLDRRLR